jgi:hypothetical protein
MTISGWQRSSPVSLELCSGYGQRSLNQRHHAEAQYDRGAHDQPDQPVFPIFEMFNTLVYQTMTD